MTDRHTAAILDILDVLHSRNLPIAEWDARLDAIRAALTAEPQPEPRCYRHATSVEDCDAGKCPDTACEYHPRHAASPQPEPSKVERWKPTASIVKVDGGFGYVDDEYRDEGHVGPFATETEATLHAIANGYNAASPPPPELTSEDMDIHALCDVCGRPGIICECPDPPRKPSEPSLLVRTLRYECEQAEAKCSAPPEPERVRYVPQFSCPKCGVECSSNGCTKCPPEPEQDGPSDEEYSGRLVTHLRAVAKGMPIISETLTDAADHIESLRSVADRLRAEVERLTDLFEDEKEHSRDMLARGDEYRSELLAMQERAEKAEAKLETACAAEKAALKDVQDYADMIQDQTHKVALLTKDLADLRSQDAVMAARFEAIVDMHKAASEKAERERDESRAALRVAGERLWETTTMACFSVSNGDTIREWADEAKRAAGGAK